MILFILLGLVVAAISGWLIFKFFPVKLLPLLSILLIGGAGYLSYLIYSGIMEPIKFNKIKDERYIAVIKQLKLIADAQEAHNKITGEFTNDGEALIKFIDTAQFATTDTRIEVVKENKGTEWAPLFVDVEKKVIDTLGFESVKDKIFGNRDYHNMLNIPGTNKKFTIRKAAILRNVKFSSVFEVKVEKGDILEGLSSSLVEHEKTAIGGDNIPGRYIILGSLNDVTTAGNWPPLYDAAIRNE